MYPGFQIYQSILSGSWQPGLPSNRVPGRFENLLQVIHCTTGCGCSKFFTAFATYACGSHPRSREALLPEALRMSEICGCGGHNVFLSLPAAGGPERFYNLLTGYCLQNYEEWISRLQRTTNSNETGKWYHYRMAGRLQSLLSQHIAGTGLPTELLLIVCRVKAAVAILLHRLITGMRPGDEDFHTGLWPREELKLALDDCDLALPARKEILSLFDRATGWHDASSTGLPAGTPLTAPADTLFPGRLPSDHPLIKLRQAFKEDSEALHRLAKSLMNKNNSPRDVPDNDVNHRVDSATACRILGIGRKTLQRLRDNNQLPFVSFGGKYYYLLEDLNALLQERKNRKKPGKGSGGDVD